MEPFATDVTRFVVHVSVTPMSSAETDESTEMPSTGGGGFGSQNRAVGRMRLFVRVRIKSVSIKLRLASVSSWMHEENVLRCDPRVGAF